MYKESHAGRYPQKQMMAHVMLLINKGDSQMASKERRRLAEKTITETVTQTERRQEGREGRDQKGEEREGVGSN